MRPRTIAIAAGTAGSLVATRMALPRLLSQALGFALRKMSGCEARVEGLDLHLVEGSLSVRGLAVARRSDHEPEATFEVDRLTLTVDWKRLLKGALAADVTLENPRAFVDLAPMLDRRDAPRPGDQEVRDAPATWQQRVRELPPFRINLAVTGGQLLLVHVPGLDGTAIPVADIRLSVQNLTNSAKLADTLMASVQCQARVMSAGRLVLNAKAYPLAGRPTFDMDVMLRALDLSELAPLIRHHAGFEITRGTLDAYVEAAAQDGRLQGYVKPVIERLEVERSDGGFAAAVKQAGAKAATRLFADRKDGQIATRIEFDGAVDRPDVDVVGAIGNFVRNAFLEPLAADLEYRLRFDGAGKEAGDARIQYEQPRRSGLRNALGVVMDSVRRWSDDRAPRMAAALSYYTAFSLAPLLILVIAIAGFAFGREAAQGRIMDEIGGLVGPQSAAAIQSMIKSAQRPVQGILATLISLIGLIGGASGVLSELKFALNKIFRAEEPGGFRDLVRERIKLLGIILGIGFLLTVSLAISAGAAAAGKLMGGLLPIPESLIHAVNFVISFAVTTALFALMYKFVPDIRMRWQDVWLGAGITSFLFTVGKSLLGLYLGKGAVGSSYGAAGSVLIILLWVYYSALIFYFGAEFTKVYAERYGAKIKPIQPVPKAA
jgi:membrane protein